MKIYLIGSDKYNWALAEDFQQTKLATQKFFHISDVADADIIHSVYWEALEEIPLSVLEEKRVVCNLSGEWARYERDFHDRFLRVADKVDMWVVRSLCAKRTLEEKNLPCYFIPYTVDVDVFRSLSFKEENNQYVIGNFMRDTQAGRARAPKMVKGPDIFADIVTDLYKCGLPVQVLLAGPRRHWIRKTLKERNVPFTYVGWWFPFDDMRINTLSRRRLNELYNRLDLSIVSSRSEAGPHAILEAGASKCPQISTPVGIALDVLPSQNVYETVEQAVQIIKADIQTGVLKQGVEAVYNKVQEQHTPKAVSALYQKLYEEGM